MTAQLVEDVLSAEQAGAHAAEAAGAVLHQLVGEAVDSTERKRLLAAHRALRRGKRLPDGPHPDAVVAWQRADEARRDALTVLHHTYPDLLSGERRELARQLTDPSLRASLEVVAEQVARQAERYVDTVAPDGNGPRRLLKSERGLIQYVLRAAMRTSPLSQLTAVGLTHNTPGGAHPDAPILRRQRSICSLDRVMLDYVVGGALAADGLLEADPHLTIPPTGAVDGQRIFVLRNTPTGWHRVAVPLRSPVRELVTALSMGPARRSHVVAHLASVLAADRRQIDGLIDKAVDGGLVCVVTPTTDFDLVDLDAHESPLLNEHLPEVARALQRLAQHSGSQRRNALTLIDRTLGNLSRTVGRPAHVAVTEDRLIDMDPVDASHWGQAAKDLGPAVELLAVFDWLADVGVALRDAFVTRHGIGSCVPLTESAPDLVADVTQTAAAMTQIFGDAADDPSQLNRMGAPDSTLVRLYQVRRRIETEYGRAVDRALDQNESEVHLTARDVDRLLSGMPAELGERPLGYGVLVQSLGDRLVINDGLPGHGMLYSRFLGPDRSFGGTTLARLRSGLLKRYAEAGSTLVEDRSHHGMNVNVHPPVLDDVLEPHDWPRLTLRHDPLTNRLEVLDGATRLKVLPIGGGHPGLYPPALSVASGLSIAGRLYNGLPDSWADRDERDRSCTRRVPRVVVGDVVINRARWYPGDDFRVAAAEPNEADRLLAINRWRAAHGVPREVVVKSAPADTGPASVGSPDAQAARFKTKPQYIDLTSTLCTRVLPRLLERRGADTGPALYLEEAAPGISDGPHAAEWVVEVSRPAGGRFTLGGTR